MAVRMQLNLFAPKPMKEREPVMSDVQYGPRTREQDANMPRAEKAAHRRAWKMSRRIEKHGYGPMTRDQEKALGRRGRRTRNREWYAATGTSSGGGGRKRKRKGARRSYSRASSSRGGRRTARRSRRGGGGLLGWIFKRPTRYGKGKSARARKCNTQGSRRLKQMVRQGVVTRREAKRARRQMYRSGGAMRRMGKRACRSMGRSYGQYVAGGYSASRRSRRGGVSRRRRGGRMSSGRGPGRVLTYNKLMGELRRRPKLKAWVCVGRRRTGCGGGRKRGTRQLGLLRP